MHVSRRQFIASLGAGLAVATLKPSLVFAGVSSRSLAFDNVHTLESLKVTYWREGKYLPDALAQINRLMRDRRSGDIGEMDPKLLDQLFAVKRKLGAKEPFQIICGYRAPQTNAQMHEQSRGVAQHSMHIEGRAADVALKNMNLKAIRNTAVSMEMGGVGYYPKSGFVHLDTGKFRTW